MAFYAAYFPSLKLPSSSMPLRSQSSSSSKLFSDPEILLRPFPFVVGTPLYPLFVCLDDFGLNIGFFFGFFPDEPFLSGSIPSISSSIEY